MRGQRLLGQAVVVVVLGAVAAAAAGSRDIYCDASGSTGIPPLDAQFTPLQPRLAQVQIMIRHGDRTPCNMYECWPNDTAVYICSHAAVLAQTDDDASAALSVPRVYRKLYIAGREFLPGDCGLGTLTQRGMAQQARNGANLRAAYVEGGGGALLPGDPSAAARAFLLRSDDQPRTVESGQALFDGMYPPAEGPSSAVPVFDWWTMDAATETIEPDFDACPALTAQMDAAQASAPFQAHVASVTAPLVAELSTVLRRVVTAYGASDGISMQFDCFMTHACYDRPMPAGVTPDLFSRVIAEVTWQNSYLYSWGNVTRLTGGFLLQDVMAEVGAVTAGSPSARLMVLYSGHDDGPMFPVLSALGVFPADWVPYAALMSIELYALGAPAGGRSPWAVRVVYDGAVMQLPGCGTSLCDLRELAAVVAKVNPTRSECQ